MECISIHALLKIISQNFLLYIHLSITMGGFNHIKTVLLLGALSGLFIFVGDAIAGPQGMSFAIIIVLIMNFGSFFFSDKLVLKMYRAEEVHETHKLYKMVNELRKRAYLPMPKVYIIPTPTPNAFATGRNPTHAAVAATEGIMNLLSDDELKGVLAHELTHVKNRDTLIATIAASIAGVISYVAMMARWAAMFGGYGGRDRDSGNGFEMLALAIVTPLIATIIQLAISRSREYLADEGGAKLSHNPKALASALQKIEHSVQRHPFSFGSRATASLFITNPFRSDIFMSLFATHPATEKRVEKLNNMR
jgi:heat shock protein HtpX